MNTSMRLKNVDVIMAIIEVESIRKKFLNNEGERIWQTELVIAVVRG